MKIKWFEKKVDERQEMDLLRVEHYGFWFMYWMLFAVLVIQAFFVEEGGKLVIGELIVFMSTSIFVMLGWMRKGVWSYQNRKVPGVKSYVKYSLIIMFVAGLPFGILIGIKWHQDYLPGILSCVAFYMVLMFGLSFITYWIIGSLTKRREKILAEKALLEDEDDEDQKAQTEK